MVVTIPEDSLIGGKTFPAASGQVSVDSGPEAQRKLACSLLLQAKTALHVITPTGLLRWSFTIGTGLCEPGEILLGALDRFFVSPFLVFVPFSARIPFMPWDLVVEATPESTGIASHNRGFRYKAIRQELHKFPGIRPTSFVVYLSRTTRGILAVHVIPLDAHCLLDQEIIILGERLRI